MPRRLGAEFFGTSGASRWLHAGRTGVGKVAMTRIKQALAMRMVLSLVSAVGSIFVVVAPLAAQQQPDLASEITEFKGTVVAARQAEISPRFDGLLSRIHFSPAKSRRRATCCSNSN